MLLFYGIFEALQSQSVNLRRIKQSKTSFNGGKSIALIILMEYDGVPRKTNMKRLLQSYTMEILKIYYGTLSFLHFCNI